MQSVLFFESPLTQGLSSRSRSYFSSQENEMQIWVNNFNGILI